MSACVVSEKHVVTLAYFYEMLVKHSFKESYPYSLPMVQDTAKILRRENVKSVNYRYNEKSKVDKFTGVLPDTDISMLSLYKQIECWDYQSCERPTFQKSNAYKMMMELKSTVSWLIIEKSPSLLNQYNTLPWGL